MSSLNRFVIALMAGLWLASGPWAGFAGASDDGERPTQPLNSEVSAQSEDLSDSRLLAFQIPKLEPTPSSEAVQDDAVQRTGAEKPAKPPGRRPISDAEQIARLQKSIEQSKKELADLQQEIDDPEGEYPKAEADFRQVDEKLAKLKKSLKDATGEDAAKLQDEMATVQKSWQLAKDRFDLAIDERKTLKEQATAIDQKIQQDQKVLDKLTGVAPAVDPNAPVPGNPNASAAPNASVPEAMPNSSAMPNASAAPNSSAAPSVGGPNSSAAPNASAAPNSSAAPNTTAAPAESTAPGVPGMPGAAAPAAGAVATEVPKPPSKELVKAKEEVQKKAVEAQQAQEEAQTVAERLATLDKNIELEQKHLQNAQKQADNASDARTLLADEFEKKSLDGAKPAELRDLARQVREADTRFADARKELREHTDRLDELQAERAQLLSLQAEAGKKVEEAKKQAEQAEKKVAQLENPFAPMNLLRWVIEHGPNLLAIMIAMIVLHWVSKAFSRRIVKIMAHSGIRGSKEEREDRANTLVGVFHNAVSVTIWIGGLLMILQESGIPIAPLLGGAAVFGLAVAFGRRT